MELSEGMVFAGSSLLAAVALFAVSLWMNAAAHTHTARRTLRIKQATRRLEGECGELRERLAELEAETRKHEAEEKALATETTQLRKACAVAAMDTFEVVHEVGTPSGNTVRFDVEVLLSGAAMSEGPAAAQIDPRVWTMRNVAQVWAPSPQEALQMVGRVFPARYGFVVTRFLNADTPPELTQP